MAPGGGSRCPIEPHASRLSPESSTPNTTQTRQIMQAAALRRFPHVPAGAGETYDVIGELLTFKVTNAQTDGAFTVVELVASPGGGPPLHTHPSSESFTILEGEFQFTGLDGDHPYTF